MIEGKTASGFAYTIDDDARDDMELFEGLLALDNGDISTLAATITALLGKDQKKALYDHCRNEKGRVSATRVFGELKEILNGAPEGSELKN